MMAAKWVQIITFDRPHPSKPHFCDLLRTFFVLDGLQYPRLAALATLVAPLHVTGTAAGTAADANEVTQAAHLLRQEWCACQRSKRLNNA